MDQLVSSSAQMMSASIAYFSMEIAIATDIPTYSGGLGILAGDMLRSAADMAIPMVGVTLVSRSGYFHQCLSPEGKQSEAPETWNPATKARRLNAKVAVTIDQREVWIAAWLLTVAGHPDNEVPILLLDTDLDENSADDRHITDTLYGGDVTYRLKQEIILGIGGVRILGALGFQIHKYHMNEGHAAFLGLELLRRTAFTGNFAHDGELPYDIHEIRTRCNFTTHTPVGAGHDSFEYPLVSRILGTIIAIEHLKSLAGGEALDMSKLAMNLSGVVNGVAKRHAETSRRMFPGYVVRAITNGVHAPTWACPSVAALFDQHMLGWRNEPEILVRADCCLSNEGIWQAHSTAKVHLLDHVEALTGIRLDAERPILGFARRMTAYKRPQLLFSDLERLRTISRKLPFQIILAGKAHPHDYSGKDSIAWLHDALRAIAPEITSVFLPNYDMALAQRLVAGVDVWVNTPQPPLEASGTSGMKAAINGIPSLSVLDGWWVEGCIEGVTGWAIGDGRAESAVTDAESVYNKLEQEVLPLYYNDHATWTTLMRAVISRNGSMFNSHRMVRRYAAETYL